MKETLKLGLLMMVFCTVAAALLSGTYILTSPRIAEEKAMTLKASLRDVMPDAEEFVQKNIGDAVVYTAKKSGKSVGLVASVSVKGYSGAIRMLVGVLPDGKVSGVKILEMTETPGLGLNAQEPKFLSQFKGKTLSDKLKAKYDIQALTGATITTQAVADGVRKALGVAGSGKKF